MGVSKQKINNSPQTVSKAIVATIYSNEKVCKIKCISHLLSMFLMTIFVSSHQTSSYFWVDSFNFYKSFKTTFRVLVDRD